MSLVQLLRQFARAISLEVDKAGTSLLRQQPGQVFCPKRIYELRRSEGDAPDGLSLEYISLALNRNRTEFDSESVESAIDVLAAQMTRAVSEAALIERQILIRLS